MQANEWIGPFVLGVFLLLFLAAGLVALLKARRRRLEAFRETREEELAAKAEEAELLEEAPPSEEEAQVPTLAPPTPAEVEAELEIGRPAVERRDLALEQGLAKTQASLLGRLQQIFGRHPEVDPATFDELEEVLLTADVGVGLTTRLVESLRTEQKARRLDSNAAVQRALASQMLLALKNGGPEPDPLKATGARPRVILFVGVNGVGKTTTIGKVAALARAQGQQVLLAAGDTFRAAAVEQLTIWGQRTGATVVRGQSGQDPASVIFNAVDQGSKSNADLILCDTAGRLHTKTELMDELKKVKRSAAKARANAPDETWLVVDATTGQNALQQAREFHQAIGLTGVILTKLDGTAKGGVVVAIVDALHLPVRYVGVGEKAEDLRPFDAETFISALLPTGASVS